MPNLPSVGPRHCLWLPQTIINLSSGHLLRLDPESVSQIYTGQRDKTCTTRCKWRTNKVVSTQEGAQVASGSAFGFDWGRLELSSQCHLVTLSPGRSDFDNCRKPASFKDNAGQKVASYLGVWWRLAMALEWV